MSSAGASGEPPGVQSGSKITEERLDLENPLALGAASSQGNAEYSATVQRLLANVKRSKEAEKAAVCATRPQSNWTASRNVLKKPPVSVSFAVELRRSTVVF